MQESIENKRLEKQAKLDQLKKDEKVYRATLNALPDTKENSELRANYEVKLQIVMERQETLNLLLEGLDLQAGLIITGQNLELLKQQQIARDREKVTIDTSVTTSLTNPSTFFPKTDRSILDPTVSNYPSSKDENPAQNKNSKHGL